MNTASAVKGGPEAVMSMTAAGTAQAPADHVTVDPDGRWEGVLGVMDEWSADRRMLRAPQGPVRTRPLPLPLLVQPELAPGHDRARLGIAHIERIWSDGNRVMGSGSIDMADPLGRELARKIEQKFIRFVSLDVDDSTELQVCLDADGGIIDNCDPATGDAAGFGQVYSGWRVMGATLLAHPAFPDAFIGLSEAPSADAAEPVAAREEMSTFQDADMHDVCVVPDEEAESGWVQAPCDTEGAVPANPAGTGPAQETNAQPPEPGNPQDEGHDVQGEEPTPEQAEEAPDLGGGCVVPDEEAESGWVQAPCDAEGAVPANPAGTGPAQDVAEAVSTGEEEPAMAVRLAEGEPTHAGIALKALDTGRILLLQRALEADDPASGMWEFPGGGIEDGEDPQAAAFREFTEETGVELPESAEVVDGWRSPNGVYQGYVVTVPSEADVAINTDHDDRSVLNPDDPDGDNIEVVAWWDIEDLPELSALRPEVKDTPWELLKNAGTTGGAAPEEAETAAPAPAGQGTEMAVDTGLPWAERDRAWNGSQARKRVAQWATSGDTLDPKKMSRAFLVVDGPADEAGSYKFGVADVIDGRLKLVWKGVVAANAALNGARTPAKITSEQKRAALRKVKTLYSKAAKRFDDPSITEAAREMTVAQPASFQDSPAQPEDASAPGEDDAAQSAPAEPQEPPSYTTGTAQDMGYGCVKQDEDGRWVQATCDEDGARTAGPDGQPVSSDGSFVCVAQDEDGRWVTAPCEQEGARIAGPDGQPLPREEEEKVRQQALAASCLPCGDAQVAEALVASAGEAPGFVPPGEWFEDPRLSAPTPVTVDPETGRISGHLAVWGTCHVGFTDRCITPPRSRSEYAYFHTATVSTTAGQVDVGVLTMDTGHASLNLNAMNAAAHYDNTGTQCAVARVGEDAHGIWLSGACLPFIDADQRLRLSLARFSGDWRAVRGSAELVAALAVNSPGFPVPQRRRGGNNREYALVAAGLLPAARPQVPEEPQAADPALTAESVHAAIQRAVEEAFQQQAVDQRRAVLAQEEREARAAAEEENRSQRLAAVNGTFGALREAERSKRMAKASLALNRLRTQALERRVNNALFGRGVGVGNADLPPVLGLPKPSRGDLDFAGQFKSWVSEQGGLPRKIKSVAKHLKKKGMSESHAIAVAVNVAKKACKSGDTNFPGVQKINSKSRSEFCAAVERWNQMKAAAKAS